MVTLQYSLVGLVEILQYSLAVLMTFRPSVLVLLSLLLRLRFMLLVALVRDMLGARRTKDSMRLASRDDRLGTLALELMGAPAASRELTDSRALAAEHRGLWEGASLLEDSDTELTSGELTLTSPMEMAVAGSVGVDESLFLASSPGTKASAVIVPELDADPDPPSVTEDSTTIGSCSCPSEPAPPPDTPVSPVPWSSSSPSALLSSLSPPPGSPADELKLMSEEDATLHTELLLPFLLEEPAPPSDMAPPFSGQLFFTRLLQDCCCEEEEEEEVVVVVPPLAARVTEGPTVEEAGPETVDETGLGDGAVAADSGSYPGASLRSNFPSAPIR